MELEDLDQYRIRGFAGCTGTTSCRCGCNGGPVFTEIAHEKLPGGQCLFYVENYGRFRTCARPGKFWGNDSLAGGLLLCWQHWNVIESMLTHHAAKAIMEVDKKYSHPRFWLPAIPDDERDSYVYCIENPVTRLIKIGTSNSPERRARDLSMASGVNLRVLAATPGGRTVEQYLQSHVEEDQVMGEWFRPSAMVAKVVSAVRAADDGTWESC